MAKVKAVSCGAAHGFSKEVRPLIELIKGEGVAGDAHRGGRVQHLYLMRRDPTRPNLSQVHLFAAEMLDELSAKGFRVGPGEIGENVLTEGIDLLGLPLGACLRLGAGAVVQVTGLRTPCRKLDRFLPGLQAHLWGPPDKAGRRTRRAGVMAIVEIGGEVRAGDEIAIALPPPPHRPLGPVEQARIPPPL